MARRIGRTRSTQLVRVATRDQSLIACSGTLRLADFQTVVLCLTVQARNLQPRGGTFHQDARSRSGDAV